MYRELYDIFVECGQRVTTDSRKANSGELFFALRGDRFNGNDYALSALDSGAGYVVVDDPTLEDADSRVILVEDALEALQYLAREHRDRLGVELFALTGTNGKTTTKELVVAALKAKYRVVGATQGNLNNHIGVPLTILSFGVDTEVAVVEMGANHPGEIADLCRIANPDVGLITNIGLAHLEGFGSLEGVKATKSELYDFLQSTGGLALYNGDDTTLHSLIEQREGLKAKPYYRGEDIPLKLFGGYNQLNATAALAVAEHFGVDRTSAIEALSQYSPTNNRSEVVESTPCGNRLIVDCYNANPSSMEVAVREFIDDSSSQWPKVAILGSMRELGEYSEVEHKKLVELSRGIETTYFVGEEFSGLVDPECHFLSAEELSEYLIERGVSSRHILLKGSRGNRLESLVRVL